GWDQNTIDVSATKYAETEPLLGQLNIEVSAGADGVRIRTIAPTESGNVGVKYALKVPHRAELAEIRSTNGSIHVSEVEGSANLRTSNGSVRTSKTRGKVEIHTSNGAVELRQTDGSAEVHTSNGAVRLDLEESRGGPITVSTSNGSVDLKLGAMSQGE